MVVPKHKVLKELCLVHSDWGRTQTATFDLELCELCFLGNRLTDKRTQIKEAWNIYYKPLLNTYLGQDIIRYKILFF